MGVNKTNDSIKGGYNPYTLSWGETVNFPSTRTLVEYGNKVYNRYPARSIFLVPRATISSKSNVEGHLSVLDPFMGSGTTAVEASLHDCSIYGVEMDPFARLIAEVSILRFSEDDLAQLENLFLTISESWPGFPIKESYYPILKNIEYWFDEKIFDDLLRLKSCIYSIIEDERFLKYFKIIFADCIKPCSKMERQSTKPYISSKYLKKTKSVQDSFLYSFQKHLKATKQYDMNGSQSPSISWLGDDATTFSAPGEIIDIAITSPPYLNAFDYTQIIKVESAWVGTLSDADINALRGVQVGHEKRRFEQIFEMVQAVFAEDYSQILNSQASVSASIKLKAANTCRAYFNDIYKNLLVVRDALVTGGEYHMVIGDGNIRGVEVSTHAITAELAIKAGYEWFGYYKYPIKDHRTSIPRGEMGGKIKHEYVIMLRKR